MQKPNCSCFEEPVKDLEGKPIPNFTLGEAKAYEFGRDLCAVFGKLSMTYELCGKALNYSTYMAFCIVLYSTANHNVNGNAAALDIEFESLLQGLVENIRAANAQCEAIKRLSAEKTATN